MLRSEHGLKNHVVQIQSLKKTAESSRASCVCSDIPEPSHLCAKYRKIARKTSAGLWRRLLCCCLPASSPIGGLPSAVGAVRPGSWKASQAGLERVEHPSMAINILPTTSDHPTIALSCSVYLRQALQIDTATRMVVPSGLGPHTSRSGSIYWSAVGAMIRFPCHLSLGLGVVCGGRRRGSTCKSGAAFTKGCRLGIWVSGVVTGPALVLSCVLQVLSLRHRTLSSPAAFLA